MPINEQVIDHVMHVMHHYFEDHPDAEDVTAEDLAAYTRARGICEPCIARFVATVGTQGDLADAFAAVWDSEAWQAMRARLLPEEG